MRTFLLCTSILLFIGLTAPLTAWAETHANLIPNHDFSQGVDEAGIPHHWSSFARSEKAGFRLTDAESSEGDYSLYVYDEAPDRGAGLRSARVLATPGNWYLAEADVLVQSGRMTLYLDFLDARGSRIEAKLTSLSPSASWQRLSIQAQAPPNTEYITLILYSSVQNQGAGYFDNALLLDITDQMATHSADAAHSQPSGTVIGFRPTDDVQVQINPPPLIWLPLPNAETYVVEYSQDPTFPSDTTERIEDIELPLYTHVQALAPGTWYWRYWGVTRHGESTGPSEHRSFHVPEGTPQLPLPPTEQWLERIPKQHPRLFVRPETIDAIRQGLHIGSVESLFRLGRVAALAGAEYPDEPPNPRAGGVLDIEAWRAAGAQMTPALDTLHELAVLYLMTQKDIYAAEGKELLLHFARMDPSGLTSYRNGAPEVAMRMLYYLPRAYTWLHDTLTEEERDIVRRSAQVRGQEAYSMIKGRPFETNPFGSHPGRMLGFLGQLSIAFLDEIPEAEAWLNYVVQLMYAVYPAWGGDDGGYSEGLNYWSSYMNWVFDFFDAFEVATGINLYQKPFFRNTGYFALYAASPGTGTPFSDSHNSTPGTGQRRVVTQLARMHQDSYLRWYVDRLGGPVERSSIHQFLLDYPAMPSAQPPEALPQARWFRDVGWVTMHKDLMNPKDNIQFSFKSSPYGSVSHSHADQNAFVLYAYGDGLAISTGYYPWSQSPHHAQWTNQTLSKNSVLIDGRGQPTFNIDAKGRILGLFHSDLFDYTAGEAATAYHNFHLQRFTRHIVYIRPDLFILVDDIRAGRPVSIDWLLHSAFEIEWDDTAQTASVRGRSSEMDVHILSPKALATSVSNRFVPPPEVDSYTNAWHMTATLPDKVDEAAIVAVLAPRPAGSEGPVVVDASVTSEKDWLRIELTHRTGDDMATDTVYMRFTDHDQAADLADIRVITRSTTGQIVRALAVGGGTPPELNQGILVIPEQFAVAVQWLAKNKAVSITTGEPRLERHGATFTAGTISVTTDFAPREVWLDGTLLAQTDWAYDASKGELQVKR